MLVSDETQKEMERTIEAAISAYSVALLGRRLGVKAPPSISPNTPLDFATMSILDQAYVAGKLAEILGTDPVRKMTQAQFVGSVRNLNLQLNEQDIKMLQQLQSETEAWLSARKSDVQTRTNTLVTNANRGWLADGDSLEGPEKEQKFDTITAGLAAGLGALLLGQAAQTDRVIETQMSSFFNSGLATGLNPDDFVWKLPRISAEKHCMRLHVNSDGSSRVYRVTDVAGNSNVGKTASEWEFVLGPVHPHCYCILYRVSEKEPMGPNGTYAAARGLALQKSLTECQPGPPVSLLKSIVAGHPALVHP